MLGIALIGRKVGMSQLYSENINVPITLVHIEDNGILDIKTSEEDGYEAVIICGGGNVHKEKRMKKPQKKIFEVADHAYSKVVKEFRVPNSESSLIGKKITVNDYLIGAFVDVRSKSKGKGFAGVMKRHNFAGLEASHGVSVTHRSHGGTGFRRREGRVFKGKEMAGQMGNKNVCIKNIKIMGIDKVDNIIYLKGSIPGAKNSVIFISHAQNKIHDNVLSGLNNMAFGKDVNSEV